MTKMLASAGSVPVGTQDGRVPARRKGHLDIDVHQPAPVGPDLRDGSADLDLHLGSAGWERW